MHTAHGLFTCLTVLAQQQRDAQQPPDSAIAEGLPCLFPHALLVCSCSNNSDVGGNTKCAPSTGSTGCAQTTAPMGHPAVRWLHQGGLRPLIHRIKSRLKRLKRLCCERGQTLVHVGKNVACKRAVARSQPAYSLALACDNVFAAFTNLEIR